MTRFVLPHELFNLRAADLCFNEQEIAEAFRGFDLSKKEIARIIQLTRGWPIAVFLLVRIARERSVTTFLENLGSVAFDDLYNYLSEQVFALMPPRHFQCLVAIAAIPNASAEEVAIALDDPLVTRDIPGLTRTIPFLYAKAQDVYEAHPLVLAMLRDRHAELLRHFLLRTAQGVSELQPLRAAQLYMEAGDERSAVTLLENRVELFLNDVPELFADLVARLPPAVLLRHPGVWASAATGRGTAIPHQQWLHEARIAAANLTHETPALVRLNVLTSLSNVLTNLGRHDEALAVFDLATDDGKGGAEFAAISSLFEAAIEARRGHFNRAERVWDDVEPLFMEVKFTRAIATEEIPVRIARYRGDRVAERALLETAVALARESESPLAEALSLEESVFAAWFAGEDELAERLGRELEGATVPSTAAGTEVFRSCLCGDFDALRHSKGIEHPKIRCYSALMACGQADRTERPEFAKLALTAARESEEPMIEVLSCIACAETGVPDRDGFIVQAREFSAQVEADALRDAVQGYAQGDESPGLLRPLIVRFRIDRVTTERDRYDVSVLEAQVRHRGVPVILSARERELLIFLATRGTCSREEIIEALWPQRAGRDDIVLRVLLNRLRARLGAQSAIVASGGVYRLGAGVVIDLNDIEGNVQRGRRCGDLTPAIRSQLKDSFSLLQRAPAAVAHGWDWFGSIEARIEQLTREVAFLLGHDALLSGDYTLAKEVAAQMLARDPCDEPSREVLIRAYLSEGQPGAAIREFRVYREVLSQELGAEPSRDLKNLLGMA